MPKAKGAKKVTLEGRTRLPQRVQDFIIELGSAMTSIQQGSGSTDMLVTSIRNFSTVDGIMANSAQNLDKLAKQLDRMEYQTGAIEKGLENTITLMKQFETMEQSGYCTTSPKKAPISRKIETKKKSVEEREDNEDREKDKLETTEPDRGTGP